MTSWLGSSSRDRRDFEGRADCENGVMGDARLADVFVAPLEDGNAVLRDKGASLIEGRRVADSDMNVSTHLAKETSQLSIAHEEHVGCWACVVQMIVCSNSPPLSRFSSFPAPNANTMLSLYSCRW